MTGLAFDIKEEKERNPRLEYTEIFTYTLLICSLCINQFCRKYMQHYRMCKLIKSI